MASSGGIPQGAELLAFLRHLEGKRWVAWAPLGDYVAYPGGEDQIRWQINHGLDQTPMVDTASYFRSRFYRPEFRQ